MDTKDVKIHSRVPGNGILAGLDLRFVPSRACMSVRPFRPPLS
jgi:hypothetical protein